MRSPMSALEVLASGRRYTIGYALVEKKRHSFIQESLLRLAASRGIDLIPIDLTVPLVEQGPFDAVLHKMRGDDWKQQLQEFALRYPTIPIIDQPEAIERLHNRLSMLQVVSELPHSTLSTQTFGIPNQAVVYDTDALADPKSLSGLTFPMIAKPLVADGSAKSHKMALVFHPEGLLGQKPPLVLQEFVNHGGVIFKVYVVGDIVQCVRRRSLPDVSGELPAAAAEQGTLSFSQVSNVTNHGGANVEDLKDAELPPMSLLDEIASGLRQALRLNLFNFDMIRDVKAGNHYLVIDINYFPGYAKMPSYETALTDFFCKILKVDVGSDARDDELPGIDETQGDIKGKGKDVSSNHNSGDCASVKMMF